MKTKISFFTVLFFFVLGGLNTNLRAQTDAEPTMKMNLQAHANMAELCYGKESSIVKGLPLTTFTFEGTGTDKIGSTYFFIDFEFGNANALNNKMLGGAYFEFTHEWCFWKKTKVNHLAIHTELDAGVGYGGDSWGSTANGWDFKSALLFGPSYFWAGEKYYLQLQLLDRFLFHDRYDAGGHGWQVTVVYNYEPVKWFTLSGYADFYQNPVGNNFSDPKSFHFAIEPYVWFNVAKHFSVGSRLRFTYNYYTDYDDLLQASVYDEKCYFVPSLSLKWHMN